MRIRPASGPRERGAAAVEFALVLPVLLLLIFGTIDYGMFFFDSIGMRQGAREAARSAVVLRVDTSCGSTVSYDNIACTARTGSNNILGRSAGTVSGGGPSQVKVYMKIQQSGSNPSPPTWVQGNQFVLCTMISEKAATGFVPFPSNGIMTSKVVMSIESGTSAPTGSLVTDTAPVGGDWSSFC